MAARISQRVICSTSDEWGRTAPIPGRNPRTHSERWTPRCLETRSAGALRTCPSRTRRGSPGKPSGCWIGCCGRLTSGRSSVQDGQLCGWPGGAQLTSVSTTAGGTPNIDRACRRRNYARSIISAIRPIRHLPAVIGARMPRWPSLRKKSLDFALVDGQYRDHVTLFLLPKVRPS